MHLFAKTVLAAAVVAACVAGVADAKSSSRAATIAARQKIFGTENVNPENGNVRQDRVVYSWLTNASFAVAVKGHVMLLDTYVTRLEVKPGRTPIVIQDLVDLRPDVIFLGHGHFDHADNAAYIAQETGAQIYASPETCDNMKIDATNNFDNGYTLVPAVVCNAVTKRDSTPGEQVVQISAFEPEISISVFRHLHSTNTGVNDPDAVPIAATTNGVCTPTPTKGNTFPCNLQDPRDPMLFPAGTPLSDVMNIATARTGPGGPIALFYTFTVNTPTKFRFAWHNSTGDIIDSCALPNNDPSGAPYEAAAGQNAEGCFPGVKVKGKTVGQNLASIMAGLGPVDVDLGAVVSLGYSQNGERDIVSYLEQIKPKHFIPTHTTAVAVEGSSLEWRDGFYAALKARNFPQAQWPETTWLVDPTDYIRPITFDLNN